MADERLLCCRYASIITTSSFNGVLRARAISFSALQNGSSRQTLVLRPAMSIDRLITGDFMARVFSRLVRAGPSREYRGSGGFCTMACSDGFCTMEIGFSVME